MVLLRDNDTIAIAPLLIKKKNHQNTVYLRGHFTKAGELDFIYKNWSYEDFKFLMDGIKSLIGNTSFLLDRVDEKSVTCDFLKEYFPSGKIEKKACVFLPLPNSYEEWFKKPA